VKNGLDRMFVMSSVLAPSKLACLIRASVSIDELNISVCV
jgi:hypothetical protein